MNRSGGGTGGQQASLSREDRDAIELELLLEAIYSGYGYDFRHYSRASIERRARHFLVGRNETRLAHLIPVLLDDPGIAQDLIRNFSVGVTEMFRDPGVYRSIRDQVLPVLRTYPSLKVWHAGCASGEEVYSSSILFDEAGLLERTRFYATDINDDALARARRGIYPGKDFQEAARHYQEAGGVRSFSDYYRASHDSVVLDTRLREHVTFDNHNLAVDGVFGETHLVFCRNVLIYFDAELRDRALCLFDESLVRGGYLCLGSQEDLRLSSVKDRFEVVDERARIYRKHSTI